MFSLSSPVISFRTHKRREALWLAPGCFRRMPVTQKSKSPPQSLSSTIPACLQSPTASHWPCAQSCSRSGKSLSSRPSSYPDRNPHPALWPASPPPTLPHTRPPALLSHQSCGVRSGNRKCYDLPESQRRYSKPPAGEVPVWSSPDDREYNFSRRQILQPFLAGDHLCLRRKDRR